jgi:hypothetical protein
MTAIQDALAYEVEIAERAKVIRGEAKTLTPELFMELWPLLCEPIPSGFIKSIGVVSGKPYESTGISSVQVQVDRMNNVLSPLWWHDHVEYHDGGTIAHVEVHVRDGAGDAEPLIVREAWGGVDRGSTKGNVYKGSQTNAAKLAFARLGPGHEVYLGATDLDPDVNAQVGGSTSRRPTGDARPLPKASRDKMIAEVTSAGKNLDVVLGAVGLERVEDATIGHARAVKLLLAPDVNS